MASDQDQRIDNQLKIVDDMVSFSRAPASKSPEIRKENAPVKMQAALMRALVEVMLQQGVAMEARLR
jgi:hypothetical protein